MTDHRQQTEADLSPDAMHQIREAMHEAVRHGFREAMSDRETLALFWSTAFDTMQSRATKETGRFVLSGIKGLASRGFWFLVVGAVVYQAGGWTALAAAVKAMAGGNGGH